MSETQKRLVTALGELVNALNVMGSDKEKVQVVKDTFSRTHRTLQQAFVKVVVIPVLQSLAEAHRERFVDPRNEAAARLASKMLEAVNEDDLYMPLV